MPRYLQALEDCASIVKNSRGVFSPKLPTDIGVYVFYEDNCPVYVGRSDRIRARLNQHGRPSSDANSASFAFNIAREAFGKQTGPEIIGTMDRTTLQKLPEFKLLFDRAKERVRNMTVRVVEIEDPIEQTIFEVYAHMKLGTPFNSFENH